MVDQIVGEMVSHLLCNQLELMPKVKLVEALDIKESIMLWLSNLIPFIIRIRMIHLILIKDTFLS